MKSSTMILRSPTWTMVFLTLFAGYLLTLCPLPVRLVWVRPDWIMMILVYWVVMFPERVGLGMAWINGLMLDVLNGTLLGEHALAMTVAIYLILRIRTRFRFFPALQQTFSILGLAYVYQLVLFCLQGFLGQPPVDLWYWLAPVTSMLLWPWAFNMLQYSQHRLIRT